MHFGPNFEGEPLKEGERRWLTSFALGTANAVPRTMVQQQKAREREEMTVKNSTPAVESTIENAQIERVFLGLEEGRMMLCLSFKGLGFGQSTLCPISATFFRNILTIFEQTDLYDLNGKFCRIDHDFGHIFRIGHVVEERWISTSE